VLHIRKSVTASAGCPEIIYNILVVPEFVQSCFKRVSSVSRHNPVWQTVPRHRRVTLHHFAGNHRPACWAAIETRPVMVTILLMALQHFLPVRSRTCTPQRQVIQRQWDVLGCTCRMSSFRPCSQAEVRRTIMKSPVKSWSLNPVPTFLLREFVDLLLPFVTCMVIVSLHQGPLPKSQHHAIVVPVLKKPGLNTADMANFRLVSNVTFMSKIAQRVVAQQLHEYLAINELLPRNQSAYRSHHSTGTTMLRVISDALSEADEQRVTLLASLDMTAAFDCVDHSLLPMRLQWNFGLQKTALEWMTSFLTGRTLQLAYTGQLSPILPVLYGVPKGSVLGPLLFVLYMTELHDVVAKHGVTIHQNADDCYLYASMPIRDVQLATDRLSRCMADVSDWLDGSCL